MIEPPSSVVAKPDGLSEPLVAGCRFGGTTTTGDLIREGGAAERPGSAAMLQRGDTTVLQQPDMWLSQTVLQYGGQMVLQQLDDAPVQRRNGAPSAAQRRGGPPARRSSGSSGARHGGTAAGTREDGARGGKKELQQRKMRFLRRDKEAATVHGRASLHAY